MTKPRFGDFFHEIPEPEVFGLPCGGAVSSECVINSLGQTYSVEVIPRQSMIDLLAGHCTSHDIALGFWVTEEAGTGMANIYEELSGTEHRLLARVDAESLPDIRQVVD